MVILHVGGHNQGALTAFDPATGAVKWSWTGDGPAYGSPIIAEIGGTRQVITFSQKNLVGVDRGERPAAVERAVRVALDDQLDHAARLRRPDRDRLGSGQAADGVHDRERRGNQWAADAGLGKPATAMSFSNARAGAATPCSRCRR